MVILEATKLLFGCVGLQRLVTFVPSLFARYLEYELYSGYVNQVVFVTPDVVQFIKLYNGK